ncbi:MAG: HAD-IC family P-type ATPase, partial [Gammaproteobacteria bacterium]|nr:HAD-IC family P-type ATPase [Gammaproteobacteria bacterium]
LYGAGKSLLYVAQDGQLVGLIALIDHIRPDAEEALAELKGLGIARVVVLTGDHREAARALGRALPAIDAVHWELKPEDKATVVRELKAEGRRIAFLGDGVNDAPALVSADVGISMPNGADLAREAAQVVLMRSDLSALVAAVATARHTQQVLKRAALGAFGINTATMALAVAGILPPVASATLHNGSTVGILGYAALARLKSASASPALQDAGAGPAARLEGRAAAASLQSDDEDAEARDAEFA